MAAGEKRKTEIKPLSIPVPIRVGTPKGKVGLERQGTGGSVTSDMEAERCAIFQKYLHKLCDPGATLSPDEVLEILAKPPPVNDGDSDSGLDEAPASGDPGEPRSPPTTAPPPLRQAVRAHEPPAQPPSLA